MNHIFIDMGNKQELINSTDHIQSVLEKSNVSEESVLVYTHKQ